MEPFIISVQGAGKERGTRIYFSYRNLKKIKEKLGENFFLFNNKKLVAHINPINETITISSVKNYNSTNTNPLLDNDIEFFDSVEDKIELELEDHDGLDNMGLDFYIPIKDTGDKYWIAEISVNDNLCYYCIATSRPNLDKEIQRKGNKHFPGLLNSKHVEIRYFKDHLVYSPVPAMIAKNAYRNIAQKKIKNIEIKSSISIPNDAELTPLIDLNKGNIKNLKIKKRTFLAKYEIHAIASNSTNIKDVLMKEVNDNIIWQVLTEIGEFFYDPINGDEIKPQEC
ncbi:MAG: hypothetical protein ACFFD2_01530 [Promethearchaeota archaeon]